MRKYIWAGFVVYLPTDRPRWKFRMAFPTLREAQNWLNSFTERAIPCKKRIHRYDKAPLDSKREMHP